MENENQRICPQCGAANDANDSFCTNCGSTLEAETPSKKRGCLYALLAIGIIAALYFIFKPMTPQEAVEKAYADKTITPIIQLYDKADEKDKAKVAYEMTAAYQDIASNVFRREKKTEILDLKDALSGLEIDNGSREYLGALFRIREICSEYDFACKQKEAAAQRFSKKYNRSFSEFDKIKAEDVETVYVYINQQLDDGSYSAYGYKSLPSVFGGGSLPDLDNFIGLIELVDVEALTHTGVYRMNLIRTGKTSDVENKVTGFKMKAPVYQAISDNFKNDLWLYGNVKEVVSPIKMFQGQKKMLEVMRDAYGGTTVKGIQLDGFDLTTAVDELNKKYQLEFSNKERAGMYYRYNNSLVVQCDRTEVGKRFIRYSPGKAADGKLATSNGVKISMSKQEVQNLMQSSRYFLALDKKGLLVYLMPNAQFVTFYFSNDKLDEINFEKNIPMALESAWHIYKG